MSNFINNKYFPALKAALSPWSKVRWATFFITRECNIQCPYCNVQKYKTADLSTGQWMLIIDKLVDYGIKFINIVGGEPTLRKDLAEIIQYISNKKIVVLLHSNFNNMTENHINDYSNAGLSILETSVDSFDSFGKLFSQKKIELLKYAAKKGILPIVSSVITSANSHEIKKIAHTILNENIVFNCGLYQNIGGQFSPSTDSLKPTYKDTQDIFNFLIEQKNNGAPVKTTFSFLNSNNLEEFYYGKKWKCNALKDNWLIINSDGNLMNCEEYASSFNFLDTDIDIFKNAKWREYRKNTVSNCSGCYHHCYFEAERFYPALLLNEIRSIWSSLRIIK